MEAFGGDGEKKGKGRRKKELMMRQSSWLGRSVIVPEDGMAWQLSDLLGWVG